MKAVLKQIHSLIFLSFLPGLLMTSIFYLFLSCNLVEEETPLFDNPLNPDDPQFIPPETFIISGPDEGETITVPTVVFTLGGNDGVTQYCTGGGDTWSEWSTSTIWDFPDLSEQTYTFAFKARYHEQAEDETPISRSITVDAVKGPALMFSRRGQVKEPNESFTIDLIAEEVADLSAVYAEIRYDDSYLRLDGWNVITGDILESTGGTVADIIEHDVVAGILKVNLVIIGANSGVNETGSLIELQFTTLTRIGQTTISLNNTSAIIGSDLNQQTINELVNCRIDVGNIEGEG